MLSGYGNVSVLHRKGIACADAVIRLRIDGKLSLAVDKKRRARIDRGARNVFRRLICRLIQCRQPWEAEVQPSI